MAKRVQVRLGDIFAVKIDEANRKFFQYIGDDREMLNSRVIRAFAEKVPLNETPDFEALVRGEVEFYAHVAIRLGLRMELWEKVGKAKELGRLDILFRDAWEWEAGKMDNPRWYIWKMNEPYVVLGATLPEEYKQADVGMVLSPPSIVERMKTGRYSFVYPEC